VASEVFGFTPMYSHLPAMPYSKVCAILRTGCDVHFGVAGIEYLGEFSAYPAVDPVTMKT
jgi:hypothetical protein